MRKNIEPNSVTFISLRAFYFVFVLALLISCGNSNQGNKENALSESSLEKTLEDKSFKMVDIPVTIITPEERAEFLVSYYWSNFDFTDTAYIHLPDITEQAMANFIAVLPHVRKETVYSSIQRTLEKAEEEPKMLHYFMEMYTKYLYDPNSPLREEEYYIPVLDYQVNSGKLSTAEKEKAKFRLDLLMKNRVGEKAANVTYTLESGKTGTLYGIKSPYTLLMFYNPDCHTCEEITNFLKSSPVMNGCINNGQLSILAFYPDEDLTIWEKHLSDIPSNWINGYDKNRVVEKQHIYDLKAIPTLYLLDKNKEVILKDATAEGIERYLWNNNIVDR